MSRVLISGGAGFIGTALARRLLATGWTVTVLDNFSVQVHGQGADLPADLRGQVRLLRGDARESAVWREALPDQDAVVHLAAETGTGQSMYEVERYEKTNIGGTAALWDCLANGRAPKPRTLVVASSRAVYGEGRYQCPEDGVVYPTPRAASAPTGGFDPPCPVCGGALRVQPTPEGAPFQPLSFYALTKQVQEQMVLMMGRALGISAFALRYQNVYGPGQSLLNPYTGILAIFANLARAGETIEIFEDGQASRDFVFIDDVVAATELCLAADGHGVYNVGSGEPTTVEAVARAAVEHFGSASPLRVSGARRAGDIRHNVADLTKITAELGFHPKWRFREGAREFFAWVESRPAARLAYQRSLEELQQRGLMRP